MQFRMESLSVVCDARCVRKPNEISGNASNRLCDFDESVSRSARLRSRELWRRTITFHGIAAVSSQMLGLHLGEVDLVEHGRVRIWWSAQSSKLLRPSQGGWWVRFPHFPAKCRKRPKLKGFVFREILVCHIRVSDCCGEELV